MAIALSPGSGERPLRGKLVTTVRCGRIALPLLGSICLALPPFEGDADTQMPLSLPAFLESVSSILWDGFTVPPSKMSTDEAKPDG